MLKFGVEVIEGILPQKEEVVLDEEEQETHPDQRIVSFHFSLSSLT